MSALARALPPLSLGFFAVASQALLFREHLLAGGGGEAGIAAFLGAWLLWFAAGSAVHVLVKVPSRWFPGLLLAYFLVWIPELLLFWSMRDLAGLKSFELFAIDDLILWTLPLAAPVSFLGGYLFPCGARWLAEGPDAERFPAARLYLLDVLGAFAGGLCCTAALYAGGQSPELLFWFAAACCLLASVGFLLSGGRLLPLAGLLLGLAVAVFPLTGQGRGLAAQRLFYVDPGEASTAVSRDSVYSTWTLVPQGEDLEVYRDGKVFHRYPDEGSYETAAALLAQNPEAASAAVVGFGGEELACRFLESGLLRTVLLGADRTFAELVAPRLPGALRSCLQDRQIDLLVAEPMRYFAGSGGRKWDLLWLNTGDPDTAAAARFLRPEFLRLVSAHLAPGGVLGLAISSSENMLTGPALKYASAVYAALGAVFPNVVISSGQTMHFFASPDRKLTTDPLRLKEALLSRKLRPDVPAEILFTLFEEDRIRERTGLIAAELEGRDFAGPAVSHFVSSMRALAHGSEFFLAVASATTLLAVLLVVLPFGLFWIFGWSGLHAGPVRAWMLCFFGGGAAMIWQLSLVTSWQLSWGSLPVDYGMLTALFMLGLAVGAGLQRRQLRLALEAGSGAAAVEAAAGRLSLLCFSGALAVLAGLAFVSGVPGRLVHAGAMLYAGLASGGVVPLFASAGFFPGVTAGREPALANAADSLGGLAAAFVGGLFFIPVLGLEASCLLWTSPLLATSLFSVLPAFEKRLCGRKESPLLRESLLRLLVLVILCVSVWQFFESRNGADRGHAGPKPVPLVVTPPPVRVAEWKVLQTPFVHRRFIEADGRVSAYQLSSAAAGVIANGFAGPVEVELELDAAGKIRSLKVSKQNETPSYVAGLATWVQQLTGRSAADLDLKVSRAPEGSELVDGMTGATITSRAVLLATRNTARRIFTPKPLVKPAAPPVSAVLEGSDPRLHQRQRVLDMGAVKSRQQDGELSNREGRHWRPFTR